MTLLAGAALISCSSIDSGLGTATTYTNPVIHREFADPAVLRAPDGWYYVYATQGTVGGRTLNIQMARSADLVHWEILGDALPEKPAWAVGKQKFWAPHVLHDAQLNRYFLYYSAEPDSAEGKCLAVALAATAAGPFIDSGRPMLCGAGIENIYPMAFDDPRSGQRLLYWGSGGGPIRVQELAADRVGFLPGSEPKEILPAESGREYRSLIEGAWMTFRDGFYYLFYSGDLYCGPAARYAVMVARADSALGPFEHYSNPLRADRGSVILERNEQWRAPGHNSVALDDADEYWMIYHAMHAPDEQRLMLLDRIVWRDGWPAITEGQPSALPQRAPRATARPSGLPPSLRSAETGPP